jgi:hypothetical protein
MISENKNLLNNHYFAIFGDDWEEKMNKEYPFEKIDFLIIAFAHTRERNSFFILSYEEAHSKD